MTPSIFILGRTRAQSEEIIHLAWFVQRLTVTWSWGRSSSLEDKTHSCVQASVFSFWSLWGLIWVYGCWFGNVLWPKGSAGGTWLALGVSDDQMTGWRLRAVGRHWSFCWWPQGTQAGVMWVRRSSSGNNTVRERLWGRTQFLRDIQTDSRAVYRRV